MKHNEVASLCTSKPDYQTANVQYPNLGFYVLHPTKVFC